MRMEKLKRYIIFFVGLFINSLGVSFITKASLGTSPISSIPYVLSLNLPLTLGQFTILFNLIIIALQLVILRRNFKPEHFLQIPVTVLFGYFIDLTMVMLNFIQPKSYITSFIYLLMGCVILGFGVYVEVLADVVMLPGESFVRAVTCTWHTEFGITKIIFDSSMTVIAALLSFIFAHRLNGVREGTIIAALLVGFFARQFGRLLAFLPAILYGEKETPKEAAEVSDSTFTIAIGREYGCGGYTIGGKIAEKLGYTFYDKEIIQKAANTTGYTEEFIEAEEEKMTNSLLYDLVNQMYAYSPEHKAPKDDVFESEAAVIKELASKNNCVIVGRCSDAILHDQKNCFRVWLSAPENFRAANVEERENLKLHEAHLRLEQQDKLRARNYHYYTNRVWGMAKNYHLCLDTSLGEDFVVDSIIQAFENWKLM